MVRRSQPKLRLLELEISYALVTPCDTDFQQE